VLPFAFTMETATSSDDVAQFVSALSRAPSIAVHTADREDVVTGIGGFSSKATIDLLIYFSSNNARNQQIGRMQIDTAGSADDRADPGLHVAMEHARELLVGQRAGAPGDDIKQVLPWREQEVITAQPITIWMQTYRVTVNTRLDEFRTVDQLLTSLRMRLTTEHNEPLPACRKRCRHDESTSRTTICRSTMPAPSHITVNPRLPASRHRSTRATGTSPAAASSASRTMWWRAFGTPESQSIRRAIARGDLIPCNMDGGPVASVDLAACPEEHPEGAKRPKPAAKPAPARKEGTP